MAQDNTSEIEAALSGAKITNGGGQVYAATLMGGALLVSGQKKYEDIFGHSVNESVNAYAKVISNLDNPGKMGNSEAYHAYQYAFRIAKLTSGVITAAQLQDICRMLASARFQFFVGSNRIRVLDLQMSHFLNLVNGASTDGNAVVLPINMSSWLNLPGQTKQELPPNENFSATLEVNHPDGTPAGLAYSDTTPNFVFQFIMMGKRFTR